MSTSTPSTPSSEVPDISPMYRVTTRLLAATAGADQRFGDVELGLQRTRQVSELGFRRSRQRQRLAGLGDALRILVIAVDAELEVQVRAGRPAGGADRADARALLDAVPLLHVDARQVRVDRAAIIAVLDLHHVAVAVLPACEVDAAFADAAHRGAGGRGVVHAVVLAPGLQDRVEAHRETGRD